MTISSGAVCDLVVHLRVRDGRLIVDTPPDVPYRHNVSANGQMKSAGGTSGQRGSSALADFEAHRT